MIVVNYNSKPFIGIFKRLIKGIVELQKLVDGKLLLVDNASTDGSYEEIVEHAHRLNADFEAIRLSRNFGFTRAVNIAWHYARKRWCFRYLALLNNDLVIVPRNFAKVLKYLKLSGVAGVQGIIMQMRNTALIDNAGFLIDQLGQTYPVCRGYTLNCARLYTPSYISGACSIYRADAIEKLGQPFDNRVESYYDDKHLGLRLWNAGYKLLHIPVIVAYHLGSASYSGFNAVIKGPLWFEGILLAEIAPTWKSMTALFLLGWYGLVAAFASLLTARTYIKSYVKTVKKLSIFTNKLGLKNVPKVPPGEAISLLGNRVVRGAILRRLWQQ